MSGEEERMSDEVHAEAPTTRADEARDEVGAMLESLAK
jgi:hypothetical protein